MIGFVGVGNLGSAMVRMLRQAGFEVLVWARHDESHAQFSGEGIGRASTLSELGSKTKVVCICVFNDDDVREVLFTRGLSEALQPGAVVVIHSTVKPTTCVEAASRLPPKVTLVDAPVTGGPHDALERRLTVMLGGDEETLEHLRPVFSSYASVVRTMGDIGSGQRMKILNNVMLMVNMRNALFAGELAESFGLSRDTAFEVLANGSGGSAALKTIKRIPLRRDALVQLMRKELISFRTLGDSAEARKLAQQAEEVILYLEAWRSSGSVSKSA